MHTKSLASRRFQTPEDNKLFLQSEKLRKANLLKKTFINRSHLTTVILNDKSPPTIIRSEDELLKVFDVMGEDIYLQAEKIISS